MQIYPIWEYHTNLCPSPAPILTSSLVASISKSNISETLTENIHQMSLLVASKRS